MDNKKRCFGTLIVIGIACSWVLATELSGRIQTEYHFTAPFFLMWFSTNWVILSITFPFITK